MSYEHSTTDTHIDAVPEQAEHTILDIIEQRFWNPYAELIQRREQHQEVGLDTTALDQEIDELNQLYSHLGGDELTKAENDVNEANDAKQAAIAENRFQRAQKKFYANLQKHDSANVTPGSAEQKKPSSQASQKTNSSSHDIPKKATNDTLVRGGTYQREDNVFVVDSKPEHQEEFLAALQDKLEEMVKYGRITKEQAANRLADGRNIAGGLTGHAVKDAFRFANNDPSIKEHDRRTAQQNQLAKADRPVFGDEKINKWFADIMENTSISQAQKEYMLRFGPDGQQRDKIDTNEIKRQLEAEGFDYSGITPEQQPLSDTLQAELSDARVTLGLAPSESLSGNQSDELNNAREALGLPAEKKVKVGRALLKSAGSLPRTSYEGAREIAWKSTNWINRGERNDTETTDKDKKRTTKAKKVGRKTWSIFAREEKPASNNKIKKSGLSANKKLSKSLKHRQRRRN